MAKSILDIIVEAVIADMIAEEMNEEQETKKPVKKIRKIEPPVVSLSMKNILVTFDEDDTDGIYTFNEYAETMSCTIDKNENVFIIKAEIEVLYDMIMFLTTMYYSVVIC